MQQWSYQLTCRSLWEISMLQNKTKHSARPVTGRCTVSPLISTGDLNAKEQDRVWRAETDKMAVSLRASLPLFTGDLNAVEQNSVQRDSCNWDR
jgi:hypothetical protein